MQIVLSSPTEQNTFYKYLFHEISFIGPILLNLYRIKINTIVILQLI